MFSLLSSSPLSEFLAPDLSPLEEFITQYEAFLGYFTQQRENGVEICKSHIESTNLTKILTRMCNLLVFEQDEVENPKSADSICTSIEYFLQSNIADILAVYAQADAPLGLCPIILLFFNKLIVDCKMDLMPHACFHNALNKLIAICGRTPAGPYETFEMILLNSLTDRIYEKPAYINFVAHEETFQVVDSLLALLLSPDSNISKQAGDCIIKVIAAGSEHSDRIIAERTPFCEIVINQVIAHYNEIPRSLNAREIEVAIYSFRMNQFSNTTFTQSVRKFLSFLKWYIFFDMLILHSNSGSPLAEVLLAKFRTEFLESFVLSDILGHGFDNFQEAIDNCFLTTVLLSNCLRNTESHAVADCIAQVLTITIEGKYMPYHPDVEKSLIQRCNLKSILLCESEEFKQKQFKLANVTLQLFEDLLMKPSKNILDKLILNDLRPASARNEAVELDPKHQGLFSDKINIEKILDEILILRKDSLATQFSGYSFGNQRILSLILYYFDSLVPAEFKFGTNEDYELYCKEAIKGFRSFLTNYESQDSTENSSEECQEEFFRLIDTIFDNFEHIIELPYEVGIQLFSIIAKISLIPDSRIDARILDSLPSQECSSGKLFDVLFKLVGELQIKVSGIERLDHKLCQVKKLLLGEVKTKVELLDGEERILQSIIVIDEFCKEISAIAFIKQKLFGSL